MPRCRPSTNNNHDGTWSLSAAQLSGLTLTTGDAANITLHITATDTESDTSASSTKTINITVDPLAPTVSPVAETGVEGSAIALNLGVTLNKLGSETNTLSSLVVSAIPVGAVLSDGHGNTFTASLGNTSVDVSGWSYTSLTITPANDTNFTLQVAATRRATPEGNLSTTTTNTESVTVNPTAPTESWAATATR